MQSCRRFVHQATYYRASVHTFYRGSPLYVRRVRTITPRARYRFVLSPSRLRAGSRGTVFLDICIKSRVPSRPSRTSGRSARGGAPRVTPNARGARAPGNKSPGSGVSKRVFALFISIRARRDISCVLLPRGRVAASRVVALHRH